MCKRIIDPIKPEVIKKFQGMLLKNKRIQFEMTQRQLSNHLGVSHTSVRMWERGSHGIPMYLLPFFTKLFSISISDWFPKQTIDNYLKLKP